jgi:mono/diheme cytochrome c family protein
MNEKRKLSGWAIALLLPLAGCSILAVLGLLLQAVPYGRDHTNPPVVSEPNWDSPATRDLAKRACFDCHSNETIWPWYSNIAPGSWLIQRDVDEGREKLNFSDWDSAERESDEIEEIEEVVMEGEMPPAQYLILHPEANLSTEERQILVDGFLRSLQP